MDGSMIISGLGGDECRGEDIKNEIYQWRRMNVYIYPEFLGYSML